MAKCKCAIFGIFNAADNSASQLTYYGLHALQHRGQESAGIASFETFLHEDTKTTTSNLHTHKGFGLVLDVFSSPEVFQKRLLGNAAIGHTRYSTAGSNKSAFNIQPFTVNYKRGHLALAHNGNLSNFKSLHDGFIQKGTLFATTSDSEVILHLMAQSTAETEIDQFRDALSRLEGAYSLILMSETRMMVVRDPNGFRPLVLGRLGDEKSPGGAAYCVASETCAFDIIGATFLREIEPGELLVIDREGCRNNGNFASYRLNGKWGLTPCVFEFVYFARPDSQIFGAMVDAVRRGLGIQLARESPVPRVGADDPAVVVVPVPDSSNTSALGFVRECSALGYRTQYELGIIRNHYVGRTFITPTQDAREVKVRCKFNCVRHLLQDRIVVLVDDSIVRGTTSKQLIKMVRAAGAREVHFRVASPPVISPCFYGMDFPSKEELLANQFVKQDQVAQLCQWLGADSLAYLSVDGMMEAVQNAKTSSQTYCKACFTGDYPVPVRDLEW